MWIKIFLERYKSFRSEVTENKKFIFNKKIKPNMMQKEALKRLEYLRSCGEDKALAIAATGAGKTYLGAFDVKKTKTQKAALFGP